MGAQVFMTTAAGKTADEAFRSAVSDALHENGHGGYSGTIAEKHNFRMISFPEGEKAATYADRLIEEDDSRIRDKWGPAGCIDMKNGRYLFFGWASS
jgi:hypothetical protein